LNAHEESGIDRQDCCQCLADELHALKDWLGLEAIDVSRKNGFMRSISAAT
jgi:uncharacterized protein YcaQ